MKTATQRAMDNLLDDGFNPYDDPEFTSINMPNSATELVEPSESADKKRVDWSGATLTEGERARMLISSKEQKLGLGFEQELIQEVNSDLNQEKAGKEERKGRLLSIVTAGIAAVTAATLISLSFPQKASATSYVERPVSSSEKR